jgi:hypothetical protein
MGAEKIQAFYDDPVKSHSDVRSLRSSVFAKRAAVDQSALWTALRWSYYAGSIGRNLIKHHQLPRVPGVPALRSTGLPSGI